MSLIDIHGLWKTLFSFPFFGFLVFVQQVFLWDVSPVAFDFIGVHQLFCNYFTAQVKHAIFA
jgi:hypothetical protein